MSHSSHAAAAPNPNGPYSPGRERASEGNDAPHGREGWQALEPGILHAQGPSHPGQEGLAQTDIKGRMAHRIFLYHPKKVCKQQWQ